MGCGSHDVSVTLFGRSARGDNRKWQKAPENIYCGSGKKKQSLINGCRPPRVDNWLEIIRDSGDGRTDFPTETEKWLAHHNKDKMDSVFVEIKNAVGGLPRSSSLLKMPFTFLLLFCSANQIMKNYIVLYKGLLSIIHYMSCLSSGCCGCHGAWQRCCCTVLAAATATSAQIN